MKRIKQVQSLAFLVAWIPHSPWVGRAALPLQDMKSTHMRKQPFEGTQSLRTVTRLKP